MYLTAHEMKGMMRFVPKNVREIFSLEQISMKTCNVEEESLLGSPSEPE
jgi:hypothetical protein